MKLALFCQVGLPSLHSIRPLEFADGPLTMVVAGG